MVDEDVGTEELCAVIVSGSLQREVIVSVVFMDRGAKGDPLRYTISSHTITL